jgi:hypothetical protein
LGNAPTDVLESFELSRHGNLADLFGKIGPDAWNFRQLAFFLGGFGKISRPISNHSRGIAISADPKRIRPFDFEQIGQLVEDRGDLGVVNGHLLSIFAKAAPTRVVRILHCN